MKFSNLNIFKTFSLVTEELVFGPLNIKIFNVIENLSLLAEMSEKAEIINQPIIRNSSLLIQISATMLWLTYFVP